MSWCTFQEAFGKEKLQEIWPKLLPTLPGPKAAQLAEVAGVEFNAGRQALKHDLAPVRQVSWPQNCFGIHVFLLYPL